MTLSAIIVLALGLPVAVGAAWLFTGRPPRPVSGTGGRAQEVVIMVRNGVEPDTVLVESGQPVRLLFYRDGTSDASSIVRFPDLEIERPLEPFKTTPVEFTLAAAGDYTFACGPWGGCVSAHEGMIRTRPPVSQGHKRHG